MANTHTNRGSSVFGIGETCMKTSESEGPTPTKMAKRQKLANPQCW